MVEKRFSGDEANRPSALNTDSETTAPRRRTPWDTVEGRVISLVSRKGGVGKTTSAINLGAALALSGHTVLVVGTDPQCGVCRTLGYDPLELPNSLTDIFTEDKSLTDLATPSTLQGLFFVSPRIITLKQEEEYVQLMDDRMDDFLRVIDQARMLYDTILIDCPPSLGAPTRAALLASDSYMVPVQAEELCRDSLGNLIDFVGSFRNRNFPGAMAEEVIQPLALEGLFLTMANERTRMGRHVAAKVAEDFGSALFDVGIPRTTRLSEMALKGKPAVIYDRRSPGSRAYFDLADELVKRYCQAKGILDSTLDDDADALVAEQAEPEVMVASQPDESAEKTQMAVGDEPISVGGGLDRFLNDLGSGSTSIASTIPPFEEPRVPEMVSLDDLLAEEEQQSKSNEDWDEDGYWSRDGSDPERLN